MEKNYQLRHYPFNIIIYSVSYITPLNELKNIENELTITFNGKYKGSIIFDLLLSNGNQSDRFIKIFFNKNKFDINTIENIKPSATILNKALRFYYENNKCLNNSVLNKAQRFFIKNNKHLKYVY